MGSFTIAVLAFLFWRHQRQNPKTSGACNQFLSGGPSEVAELAGIDRYSRWHGELPPQPPELPYDHVRIELDSRNL